jgi:hypothetical protein
MNTVAALKEAFAMLVFPLEPDCALTMAEGDIGRVNFDGALSFGLDVTYGLGTYKFSAPGVDAAKASIQKGFDTLTLPAATVQAGVTGAVSYSHTDHFGAIVHKPDPQMAMLYLVRSSADEVGVSAGIRASISVSSVSATLDKTKLAAAVNKVTGTGGSEAAALADQLQSSLVSRTNQWLQKANGDAGLLVQLSRQKNRALLYAFQADLTQAALTEQSWMDFATGDVKAAVGQRGLTLLPGSGVSDSLQRSVSIGLHFFNFFSLTDRTVYFQKSTTEVGPDGSIRYLYDIGKETDLSTKKTLATSRIHFVASATEVDHLSLANVEVDLAIELVEKNKAKDGHVIAAVVGSLPPSASVQATQNGMQNFLTSTPAGQLTLALVLKPSAYARLSCSPFTGVRHDIPPALPQEQDQDNWYAFRNAVRTLDRSVGPTIARLRYEDWEVFNQYGLNGIPTGTPNRRIFGNPARVPPSFYADRNVSAGANAVSYFLRASQHSMNLLDGVQALAGILGAVDTPTQWNNLLADLTPLARELDSDWTRPVAWAILQQCGPLAQVASDIREDSKAKALTCTVTVS